MKEYFVFRNYTVEYLFKNNFQFSGYNNSIDYNHNADVFIWFYLCPIKENISNIIQEIDNYKTQLSLFLANIPPQKQIILFTLDKIFGVQWENSNTDLQRAIKDYNHNLYNYSQNSNNIFTIDISDFLSNYRKKELINWKYYYISQMLINPFLAKEFKLWFEKKINSINHKRKKCIILDLDNTLWGGILGEDGLTGIKIGNDYPGNVYLDLQKNLLEMSKKGVILTICSKNNEKDVLEVWENNPYMILKKKHFVSYRINWNNKAENIVEIAKELNIGTDSMVFIDDNPVERELVKNMLPEIEVPDFPNKIYELNTFFNDIYNNYFQVNSLTNEDKEKISQYKLISIRNNFKKTALSFDDYIKGLETEISIEKANKYNITRIAQMTQKTNQFNLTTKRYIETDILKLIEKSNKIYCFSVKDKFGDNGISGLIIIDILNNSANIDSFLLSCRILGRKIEIVFFKKILNILFDNGIKNITANYVPTKKNGQVADWYEKMGFELLSNQNETKYYTMKLNKKFEPDKNIKVICNETNTTKN